MRIEHQKMDQVKLILTKIHEQLDHIADSSLFDGRAGHLLFELLYSKHFLQNGVSENFNESFQQLVITAAANKKSSLCSGYAGVSWFFTYLHKYDYIDIEDNDMLCTRDDELKSNALFLLEKRNSDFLHGAIGIAYYLLYKKDKDMIFFKNFFGALKLLLNGGDVILPYFNLRTQELELNKTNLSMSHGITSILKFFLQCYAQNVGKVQALELIDIFSKYLVNHSNANKSYSHFPSIFELECDEKTTYSRLGWCYGDLSIGFVLYEAGLVLKNNMIRDYALTVLKHCTTRRHESRTLVYDAGICHGSSGIAHIFNKMWHLTKDKDFGEAREFWITKTIDFLTAEKQLGKYRRYDAGQKSEGFDSGLLEGSSGIGLVLLSYLTSDFSWDYCIMLN